MLIELQSHSTVSDGQLAPGEVVAQAWEAGVTTLALTDHDAVAGVEEAAEAAKGFGIELVPAIEMSCVHEYAEDLHICGYWVDLGAIGPACERAQKERVNRAEEIIQRLRNWGFEVTLVPGAKAFVPRRWPTAEQAIALIHEAGGTAVIAHPYWDIDDPDEVEDLIRTLEPDGVEAFYPPHTQEQTEHLLHLCDELGLVPTASSDYHGPTHKTFSKFGDYNTYDLAEPVVPPKP